jgi:hypothetical protein
MQESSANVFRGAAREKESFAAGCAGTFGAGAGYLRLVAALMSPLKLWRAEIYIASGIFIFEFRDGKSGSGPVDLGPRNLVEFPQERR